MGKTDFSEFDKKMSAVVNTYISLNKEMGNKAVEFWKNKYKTKPERWPNGAYQKSLTTLDSKYCSLEPARKFGESLHRHLRIANGLENMIGNRLKISGVVQEIVLGSIIQEFINSLGKGEKYLVLHDQLLLNSGTRHHRCDLAIVKKIQNAEHDVASYRERVVLFIECKSNINKRSIFKKFYEDTRKGCDDEVSSVNACIVAREPDGNLKNLYPSNNRESGLKDIFRENNTRVWINATSNGLVKKTEEEKYEKNKHIPVFFLPDGGGMHRLFSSLERRADDNDKQENDCDLLERVKPCMPWFGISALLHYVFSCLDDDGAFKNGSWKNIPN